MASLRLRPEAVADLNDAYAWYKAGGKRVLRALRSELRAAFARIRENPGQFPKFDEDFHRMVLQKFPYAIYYLVENRETIVVAVFPQRDDPERLARRLRSQT